jgi:hypothetical protein
MSAGLGLEEFCFRLNQVPGHLLITIIFAHLPLCRNIYDSMQHVTHAEEFGWGPNIFPDEDGFTPGLINI